MELSMKWLFWLLFGGPNECEKDEEDEKESNGSLLKPLLG